VRILKKGSAQVIVLLEALKPLPALAVFAVLVSTLGVNHAFAQENFLVYENSDMGLRVDYPSDWYLDDSVFGVLYFDAPQEGPNDYFSENIGVAIEYLQEPVTLDEYVDFFF